LGVSLTDTGARRWCWHSARESIDVDRSRKVTSSRIARKPAPMLVPDTLTVKMTVKTYIAKIIYYKSTTYMAR
jgi:hypothetical protein